MMTSAAFPEPSSPNPSLSPGFSPSLSPAIAVEQAFQASRQLALFKGTSRSQAVQALAAALKQHQNEILEANTLDLETSREMAVSEVLLDWLKLTPERLQTVVNILQRLSELPDPIGRVLTTSLPVEQGQTYFQLMPLGVVALVHESLPDLAAIAAGLCLRTGNSLILKGGSEASHTNAVISQILQGAIETAGLPANCLISLAPEQGSSIRELVTQDRHLNLVIPYGRPHWVEQVVRQSTAPVLRTAMGNCYLYWSPSASPDLVRTIVLDSHLTQPDPVNAIEKVLLSPDIPTSTLSQLMSSLQEKGFAIRGDAALAAEFPGLPIASSEDWGRAYLDRVVAFRRVPTFNDGVDWINQYSSGHADCLVTESYQESHQFAARVDSASIYINSSPRFYRAPKRGDAVCLGMSNQKGYRRGSIGLETLTTMKQVVQGLGA
jgi:glutamate-5-semialdehyde dehydrogenase